MLSTGSRLDKESSTAAYLPPYVDGLAACKYLFQNVLHVSVTCDRCHFRLSGLVWAQKVCELKSVSLEANSVLTYEYSFYSFKDCCMHPNVWST